MDKVISPNSINFNGEHIQEAISHLNMNLPNEGCGLIAGINHKSKAVFPIENVLKSPKRFLMNPQEQIKAMIEIENNHWELLAIYHSHPNGPAHPSRTDIQEGLNYPSVPQIIFNFQNKQWAYKGYIIGAENFYEIQLIVF